MRNLFFKNMRHQKLVQSQEEIITDESNNI
jgi:hypothetical protein